MDKLVQAADLQLGSEKFQHKPFQQYDQIFFFFSPSRPSQSFSDPLRIVC